MTGQPPPSSSPEPGAGSPRAISYADLEAWEGARAPTAGERVRTLVGFRLARYVFFLIVLALIFVAVFAVVTYPDLAQIQDASGDQGNGLAAYAELRKEWFSNLKDLIQLLLVSMLVPVLSTLIGYIFGRSGSGGSEDDAL